jgi:hypothetical protein
VDQRQPGQPAHGGEPRRGAREGERHRRSRRGDPRHRRELRSSGAPTGRPPGLWSRRAARSSARAGSVVPDCRPLSTAMDEVRIVARSRRRLRARSAARRFPARSGRTAELRGPVGEDRPRERRS